MDSPITLFWFRRDLRLEDNHGLYQALSNSNAVLPIFIFDTNIVCQFEDKKDLRVQFMYEQVSLLKAALERIGSSLRICYGEPTSVYTQLHEELSYKAVYTNHDYEPYARQVENAVGCLLRTYGVDFHTCKDQVIFEKDEVMQEKGRPYTVFTPYMHKWKRRSLQTAIEEYPSERLLANCLKTKPMPMPMLQLQDMGFQAQAYCFPSKAIDIKRIQEYAQYRDIPSCEGTSKLSVHLRFGTISIRKVTRCAQKHSEAWLNELIWRNFYMMILWHFPHVVERSFKPAYDAIAWQNDVNQFHAWCQGKTGYPMVDAGMRELNSTGYMHNRLRMITASFLTKHLLIDWRWGEQYFASKLIDFELASNNGGWQWAAGSGCDAAPYFRIFSPEAQTKKFDPECKYIHKWVSELHSPDYPQPIVDHTKARERALLTYKKALRG